MTTALRLAELSTLHAARKDELDLPRTMTQREVHAYLTETAALHAALHALRHAADTLAEHAPALAADTAWLAHLTQWRPMLCDELLRIKSPIRDRAVKERADALTFSIKLIDFGLAASTLGPLVTLDPTPLGPLMHAAGYATDAPALTGPRGWRGSTKEVEQRIRERTKQQATAQARLNAALLTEDERATRDAERDVLRETLNKMLVRNNSDGTGLVAFTPDGDPLPVADMTPAQRAAFAAFS